MSKGKFKLSKAELRGIDARAKAVPKAPHMKVKKESLSRNSSPNERAELKQLKAQDNAIRE